MPVSNYAGSRSRDASYLFYFLLLANLFQYMEAGAVPALLVTIADSFQMDAGQQGLLGGVVYLSLGVGGPCAGYLLKNFPHKLVVVGAVISNMLCTVFWAMTPVGHSYSTSLFILLRFLMGLCQCIICVYLPLWTNENAPRDKRTTWMSYLQVCFFHFSFSFCVFAYLRPSLLFLGISSFRCYAWLYCSLRIYE